MKIIPARFPSQTGTILLLLGGLLVLLIPFKNPFNIYDEGLAVFNATRIMHGEIPYKDFWTIYPPGQFYVLAALFKIFGTSLFVSRVYDTVVRISIALSLFLIAQKITSRILACFVFIATVFLLGSVVYYTYPVFPALALGLLSILGLLEYMDAGRRYWLFLSGTLMGLAFVFRWDIGLYFGLSVAATILLLCLVRVNREMSPTVGKLFSAPEIAILIGPALTVVLMGYGYVGLIGGFGKLWDQAFLFPVTIFHQVRWVGYPGLLSLTPDILGWLRFYFPLAVYVLAFFFYARSLLVKQFVFNTHNLGRITVVVLGGLLFVQGLSRYDAVHIIPTSLMAVLVIVSLFSYAIFNSVKRVVKFVFLLMFAGLVVLYIFVPVIYVSVYLHRFPPTGCYSHVDRAGCVFIENDQEQAVEYIQAHTSANEPIFVGNRRHDLILFNDIGFYFLSGRPSATGYAELHPGVATTLPVQQEIAHDLESNNVHWIVLVNIPDSDEPNASAVSSGIRYLDDFIRSNYSPVAEFGDYQILELQTR